MAAGTGNPESDVNKLIEINQDLAAYFCKSCGYSSQNKIDVIRHVECKHIVTFFKCRISETIIKAPYNLERHFKTRHSKNNPGVKIKDFVQWHWQNAVVPDPSIVVNINDRII